MNLASTRKPGVIELIQEPSWMDPIVEYIKTGEQPKDKIEAHFFPLKAARYALYNDKLYRRGYSMPLLKYVTPSKAKYIIREIHEGTCGNHARGSP